MPYQVSEVDTEPAPPHPRTEKISNSAPPPLMVFPGSATEIILQLSQIPCSTRPDPVVPPLRQAASKGKCYVAVVEHGITVE